MSDVIALRGLVPLRALLFAGECLLASALLPLAAFAVAALLRRRAALRHLAWTTMFGVLAVLPLAALLLPPRRIVSHVAAPAAAVGAPAMAAPVMAAPPPSVFTLENIVLLLAALWLAGLAWQLLRLCIGAIGLMRLRRRSAPFVRQSGTGCAARLDMRLAPGAEGPSTFGILRPIVLLPQGALAWPAARLEAVLRHEAAHVARRDTASRLLARLVCALYWPNPLLWLAARAARHDAEIAADDAVLASGMTPSLYAAELLGLAAESRGLAPGIAMAGSPLAERVQSVLATSSTRAGVTRMDIAKTACLGLAAALLLGAARFDIAVAQDAAPPPVPAAAPAAPATPAEARMAQRAAEMEARTVAVKAKADAVAAQAKAKAEAETDPVKKAQYAQDAAKMAQQSAQLRAQADQMRVQMEQIRPQLAQAMANAHVDQQVARALADAHISETVAKALADAHIDEKLAKALAEAHLDEQTTRAIASVHLEETINKAMAEAQPKIRAALERAERAQRLAAPVPPDPALAPPPVPEITPVLPPPPQN